MGTEQTIFFLFSLPFLRLFSFPPLILFPAPRPLSLLRRPLSLSLSSPMFSSWPPSRPPLYPARTRRPALTACGPHSRGSRCRFCEADSSQLVCSHSRMPLTSLRGAERMIDDAPPASPNADDRSGMVAR